MLLIHSWIKLYSLWLCHLNKNVNSVSLMPEQWRVLLNNRIKVPSSSSTYLLSCLNGMEETLGTKGGKHLIFAISLQVCWWEPTPLELWLYPVLWGNSQSGHICLLWGECLIDKLSQNKAKKSPSFLFNGSAPNFFYSCNAGINLFGDSTLSFAPSVKEIGEPQEKL